MFEMAQLHDDSLREYDELELCYLEAGISLLAVTRVFIFHQAFMSVNGEPADSYVLRPHGVNNTVMSVTNTQRLLTFSSKLEMVFK